jgi:hypothetical protein
MDLKIEGLDWEAKKIKINKKKPKKKSTVGATPHKIGMSVGHDVKIEGGEVFKFDLPVINIKLNTEEETVEKDEDSDYCDEDGNAISFPDNAENVQKHLDENGLSGLYKIVIADNNTIQVDLDEEASVELFQQNYEIIKNYLGPHTTKKTLSKSKKLHVTIKTTKQFKAIERIAIQAILGSDLLRESLNFRNLKAKHKNPILFIEAKDN